MDSFLTYLLPDFTKPCLLNSSSYALSLSPYDSLSNAFFPILSITLFLTSRESAAVASLSNPPSGGVGFGFLVQIQNLNSFLLNLVFL